MHHDMFVKFCGSRLWGSERSAEQTWDNMLADARILKVIDWETDDIARVVMVLVPIPKNCQCATSKGCNVPSWPRR